MEYKLELVVVPVSDVDRAKAFYADQMGFTVDVDHQISDDMRVVQVTPPGSGCSISFGKGIGVEESEPGSLKGLQLCVADIEASARGPVVARRPDQLDQASRRDGFREGKGDDWNSFIFFDDPDGNSWAIQESPTMRDAAKAT